MKRRSLLAAVAGVLLCQPVLWACRSPGAGAAAECDTDQKVHVERARLGRVRGGDQDWCQACVWSETGFVSCQRVYGIVEGEARDAIRPRARAKACEDAGWPKDACPDDRLFSLTCKGDPPPPGTKLPGEALQDLYRQLNPEKFKEASPRSGGAASDAGI